jgi:hypothetical protein
MMGYGRMMNLEREGDNIFYMGDAQYILRERWMFQEGESKETL